MTQTFYHLFDIRDVSGNHPPSIDATTPVNLMTSTSPGNDSSVRIGDTGSNCTSGDLLGSLSLFVQSLLAFLAFTVLIAKRFCEPRTERRPWKIWFFDTSKQGFGAAAIHFANIFLASMFQGDPCTWYMISFLLDSTIGLFIIYIGLKVTQLIVKKNQWDSLKFGEYGKPAQCSAWIGQCGLYILVMMFEKILTTLLVLFPFWRDVRNFIMSPIKDPHVEVIIVMFIVPVVVNIIMFWVVDNFLMRKKLKWRSGVTNPILDGSVRYSSDTERVKYYSNGDKMSDNESDILLSLDEDSDSRHTRPRNDARSINGFDYRPVNTS